MCSSSFANPKKTTGEILYQRDESRCRNHKEVLKYLIRIENKFARVNDQDLLHPVIEMKTFIKVEILKYRQKSFRKFTIISKVT